jgi:orotate phosphoribosyltransferase
MDAPMNAMIGQLFGTVALHHYTLRGLSYDAVGGMATAAIPLVTAMTMHGNRRGFYVRDNNKAHGTKQQIEGNLNKGDRVIIVDDVLTTGKSIMQAVQVVRDYGCEVVGVLCVVSRDPQAIDYLKSQGIQNVHALFSIAEILNQGVGV